MNKNPTVLHANTGFSTNSLSPLVDAILNAVSHGGRCVVAIDGGAGSGKSTLAQWLAQRFDANVHHTDDYFPQAHQRTAARLAEPGGNLDRERFASEILSGIVNGTPFSVKRFDCATMRLCDAEMVTPRSVEIVEGSYSLHPELRDAYDIAVFVTADLLERYRRIASRNGAAGLEQFKQRWIPLEDAYFDTFNVEGCVDFVVRTYNTHGQSKSGVLQ